MKNKSGIFGLVCLCLMQTACTSEKEIDARIDSYMETTGRAKVEEMMRKILLEARDGKAIGADAGVPPKSELPIGDSPVLGNPSAQKVLTVFVDYSDAQSGPLLEAVERIAEKKKAKVVLKFSPKAANGLSIPIAKAVLSANVSGKLAPYHSRIVGQRTLVNQQKLIDWSKEVGISTPDFVKLLEDSRWINQIKEDQQLLQSVSPGGAAPIAFIDGIRLNTADLNKDSLEKKL